MAQPERQSDRIKSKSIQNDGKTLEEKQKDEARFIYGQDFPRCDLAFVRILPDYVMSIPMPEDRGLLHVASLPEKKNNYEWTTSAVYHNEDKLVFPDSFNLMNDDYEYRMYLEGLSETDWSDKEDFIAEYKKVGRDIDALERCAFKRGRKEGIQVNVSKYELSRKF